MQNLLVSSRNTRQKHSKIDKHTIYFPPAWSYKVTIKNVVFDFGGVLLDWNPRYFYSSIFNDDEKMEYFIKNIVTSTWNSQMDKGRTFEECMSTKIRLTFTEKVGKRCLKVKLIQVFAF